MQQVYIRRAADFERLTAWVDKGNTPLIVTGDAGMGKSALLANWGKLYQESGRFLFWHFCEVSERGAHPVVIMQRLHESLQQRYQFNLEEKIPYSTEIMREKLDALVQQDVEPVVVIIDGLNQLDEAQGTVDWLLEALPPSIRLIVSTSKDNGLTGEVFEVQPLSDADKTQLIVDYLEQYGKVLDKEYRALMVQRHQTKNPLFLKILL